MREGKKSTGFISSAILAILGAAAVYSAYKFFTGDKEEAVEEDPGTVDDSNSITDSKTGAVIESKTLPPTPAEIKLPKGKETKRPVDTESEPPEPSMFEAFSKKLKTLFSTDEDVKSATAEPTDSTSKPSPTLPSSRIIKDASTISGKPLAEGHRGKFSFDGITGGEGFAKFGSYTQAEASRIVALKAAKANTGASGGISEDIRNSIISKAHRAGLDPTEMLKVVSIESGGNPDAISSNGAIGLFQFTGATASSLGITDRFDINQNIDGGIELAIRNMKVAKNLGLDSTSAITIYLMHQLGPKSAKEVLLNAAKPNKGPVKSLSVSTQKAISQNIGGSKAKSAKEYVENTQTYLNDKYDKLKTNPVQTSLSANTNDIASGLSQSSNSLGKRASSSSSYSDSSPTTLMKLQDVKIPEEPTPATPQRKPSVSMAMTAPPTQNVQIASNAGSSQPLAFTNTIPQAVKPQDFMLTKKGMLVAA